MARSVRHTRAHSCSCGARAPALKLEMLLWEYTVGEHVPRTGLYGVLRQQPGCEIRSCLPNPGVQTGIEAGELGPKPYQANPAVELGQVLLRDHL